MEQTYNKIKIVILAAGKGKRMQNDLPKVLEQLKGKSMIEHVLDSSKNITSSKPILVVGHKAEMVKDKLGDLCFYVDQSEQLGTGHAVSCAKGQCADAEHVVVLSGDQPYISSTTIKKLVARHVETNAKITFTTVDVPDFENWRKGFYALGRVLREDGEISGIREFRDASEEERNIKEINAGGCYIFESKWLWENLSKIQNNNAQNEYYLTELFKMAKEQGEKIETIKIDPREGYGVNTKEELNVLESI